MLTPTQVGETPSVRRVRASCRAWGRAIPDPSTVALITSAFNMTFISDSEQLAAVRPNHRLRQDFCALVRRNPDANVGEEHGVTI